MHQHFSLYIAALAPLIHFAPLIPAALLLTGMMVVTDTSVSSGAIKRVDVTKVRLENEHIRFIDPSAFTDSLARSPSNQRPMYRPLSPIWERLPPFKGEAQALTRYLELLHAFASVSIARRYSLGLACAFACYSAKSPRHREPAHHPVRLV